MEIQEFSANEKILELISKLNSTGFQVKNYSVEYLTRPRFENGETANEADMYNISRHRKASILIAFESYMIIQYHTKC